MKAFLAFLLYLPLLVAAYPPLFGDPPSESIYPIANNISEFKEDCRDRYVKAANNLTRALTRVLDNPFDSDAYGNFFIAGAAATFVETALLNLNWKYHKAFKRPAAERVVKWSAEVATAITRTLNTFPSTKRGKTEKEMHKFKNAIGKEVERTFETYRSSIELYYVNRTQSIVTGRRYINMNRTRPTYKRSRYPVLSGRLLRQGDRLKNLAEEILQDYKYRLVYDADVFVEGVKKVYDKYPGMIKLLDSMKNCTADAKEKCPILLQQLQDIAPLYLPIKTTLPGPEFPFGGGSERDVLVAAFEKHSDYNYKRLNKRLSEKVKYCDAKLANDFGKVLKEIGRNFNNLMLKFSTCFPDTAEIRKRELVKKVKSLGSYIQSNYDAIPLPGSVTDLPSQCT